MKRILLKIAYDGTAYHGWQIQPNAVTVQEVMQNSLEKLLGHKTGVTGCSRTDAGVHARQFFCHIDCEDNIPDKAFLLGLNSILPSDIRVCDVMNVPEDFHARYSAKGKTYTYTFYYGTQNPFLSRYALYISDIPDIYLMNEFCKTVIGTHDFEGFSSSKRTVEDTVRSVTECFVKSEENKIIFNITANGFLYNMVRILSGTALEVGYGRLKSDCASDIFTEKNRDLGGKTLAPQGLFLEKVYY